MTDMHESDTGPEITSYTEAADTLRRGADRLAQSLAEDGGWSAAKATSSMRDYAERIRRLDDLGELMLNSPVHIVALQNDGADRLEELVTRRADWIPNDAMRDFRKAAEFLRNRSREIAEEFGFDESLDEKTPRSDKSPSQKPASTSIPTEREKPFLSRLADKTMAFIRQWWS